MSEELRDEVEAINSIYGEGSLTTGEDDPAVYTLKLPGGASSLRLSFPEEYPGVAPVVLGTHHSSGGRRGAGDRDLRLFRDVVGEVFVEGVVCLFDAVEEFSRRHEGVEEERDLEGEESKLDATAAVSSEQDTSQPDISADPPPWIISEQITDSKSTFVAHVAHVTSPAQATQYVHHLLASDRRIRSATHNITAWRIRGEGATSYQDCDDDGETAAGGRLLHLMQVMGVWDGMVVVTRWYGGVRLGPRRFAVINGVARDGFVRAGMVDSDKAGEKKKR